MSRRRRVVAGLVACGLACLAPAPARAATTVLDVAPELGPVELAGERVVWVRPEGNRERLLERRAGATRTVAVLTSGGAVASPLRVRDMEASGSLIALERTAEQVRGNREPPRGVRKTFEIVGRDRRPRRLSDCPVVRCVCRERDLLDTITPFDVHGGLLAYGGLDCQRRGTRVFDTRSTPPTAQRIPEAGRGGLRAAGRFLAWGPQEQRSSTGLYVDVYDRRARRRAYRWRAPARIARRNISLDWVVDAAGRLAVGYTHGTNEEDRSGYGVVEPGSGRLRELGRGDPGIRWIAPGRLVAVRQRQLAVHDVRTGRRRRVRLGVREDRELLDADDRCLLHRTVRRTPGEPEPAIALEVQPVPGGRPSPLCPR